MSATFRRPSPYVAYPDDRAFSILGSDARDALGLDIAAWSMSSRYLLDGRLEPAHARSIIGWTARRQEALVDAGFWRLVDGQIELVDYLKFNHTKEDIRAIQASRKEAGENRAKDAPRDPDGRMTSR